VATEQAVNPWSVPLGANLAIGTGAAAAALDRYFENMWHQSPLRSALSASGPALTPALHGYRRFSQPDDDVITWQHDPQAVGFADIHQAYQQASAAELHAHNGPALPDDQEPRARRGTWLAGTAVVGGLVVLGAAAGADGSNPYAPDLNKGLNGTWNVSIVDSCHGGPIQSSDLHMIIVLDPDLTWSRAGGCTATLFLAGVGTFDLGCRGWSQFDRDFLLWHADGETRTSVNQRSTQFVNRDASILRPRLDELQEFFDKRFSDDEWAVFNAQCGTMRRFVDSLTLNWQKQ
jgi:hypothetical protein